MPAIGAHLSLVLLLTMQSNSHSVRRQRYCAQPDVRKTPAAAERPQRGARVDHLKIGRKGILGRWRIKASNSEIGLAAA